MGLFKKKEPKKDLESQFREVYQSLNKVSNSIQHEPDLQIQVSLMALCIEKYDQLLSLIDQGAPFEREHFEKLKEDMVTKKNLYEGL